MACSSSQRIICAGAVIAASPTAGIARMDLRSEVKKTNRGLTRTNTDLLLAMSCFQSVQSVARFLRLSHGVNFFRFDLVQHSLLARLREWILILPEVLLGHLVDVFGGAVLSDVRDFAANFKVAIWIIGVH